jgi:hypothetical protein
MKEWTSSLVFLFIFSFFILNSSAAQLRTQTQPASLPKPEAVAETRLLMEALNQPNFRGLERLLAARPANTETWTFARGQALLIAETGNLLMLRQPRTEGRAEWLQRAAELRTSATRLARSIAARNYDQSRTMLSSLANSCNRCHQAFRVPTRITPFAGSSDRPGTPPAP